MPLPKFRLRQVATSAMVWDGQTPPIGAGSARTMQRDRNANGVITTNYTEKELIYFITPRLIDPAGNPLHADDEFPERHKTVPAQRNGGGNRGKCLITLCGKARRSARAADTGEMALNRRPARDEQANEQSSSFSCRFRLLVSES